MSTVKLSYRLTQESIDQHFRETGTFLPTEQTVVIDAAQLSPAGRAGYLALRKIAPGYPWLNLADPAAVAVRTVDEDRAGELRMSTLSVDHVLDAAEIDAALAATGPAIAAAEALARPIRQEAQRLAETRQAAVLAQREQERRAADEYRRHSDETERRERAAREAREAEKAAWIARHGSDYLKRAVGAGYDCQRRYAGERAAVELPGFTLDFDREAEYTSRACPSERALAEALRLTEAGYDAKVVWLMRLPDAIDDTANGDFAPGEAIVVANYLGKYTLFSH